MIFLAIYITGIVMAVVIFLFVLLISFAMHDLPSDREVVYIILGILLWPLVLVAAFVWGLVWFFRQLVNPETWEPILNYLKEKKQ